MPATFNAAGLTIQTATEIRAEVAGGIGSAFGAEAEAAALDERTAIGALASILAQVLAPLQSALQSVVLSTVLDSAEGVNLRRLALIVGLEANPATQSIVDVSIANAAGVPVTVPIGSIAENAITGDLFAVVAAGSIPAVGAATFALRAIETGPVPVPIGLALSFVSAFPGSGSLSIAAPGVAGTEGADAETDPDFRLRILASAHTPGSGTLDAIFAAAAAVDGVTSDVKAFENAELATGILLPEPIALIPGKAFVVAARGATATEIATAIFRKKPAGIKAWGSTVVNVTDSQGFSQPIGVEIVTAIRVYVELTIADGDAATSAAVTAAVAAYGLSLRSGEDVIDLRVRAAAIAVSGATTTTITAKIDSVFPPVATGNLSVAWNRIAEIAAADVSVVYV
jgi:uncharacterized phage protein gp47/JayE